MENASVNNNKDTIVIVMTSSVPISSKKKLNGTIKPRD